MKYPFEHKELSEALYDALTKDAFYVTMERSVSGGSEQRREAMLRYYDYSMKEARKYGKLYSPNGNAFGASIWSKPVSGELAKQMADEKKAFLKIHMGDASLAKYSQITGGMAERTATVAPPNSWYLSIVGIAPPFQGRGLGATLVRPILDMTDEMGLYTYLETFTPRNISFYQRLGFQEAGAFDGPDVNARYWVMVREPF